MPNGRNRKMLMKKILFLQLKNWQNKAVAFILPILVFAVHSRGVAQATGGVEDIPLISVIGTAGGGGVALQANATVTTDFAEGFESSKKIKNIIRLSFFEETSKYISSDFSVSLPVKIEYGPNASSLNEYNQIFTVTYDKDEGTKYNAKQYFSFDDAAYVRITVTGPPSPATVGSVNMADILLLESEIRATRYYELLPGVLPSLSSLPSVTNPVDKLNVAWAWPSNSGHTATELEWTWLEDELESYYYIPNTSQIDYQKLFANNATALELPYNKTNYDIPLFYDGQGKLYYRLRAVNIKADGSRYYSDWSTPSGLGTGICSYSGHNNALNWQVRTSFAEEGKLKSVVEYYDGSLRSRQTVTKENVNNTVITAESFYDYEGRPVIQILPTPGINTIIQYQANLNLFNGQSSSADNPAKFFDLSDNMASGAALYTTAALTNTSGTSQYYSANNPQASIGAMANVPDAEGFPYTVTRYYPDATGRVLAQSGVGATHKMGSGKETRYYYGTPSQEELDGLFGTEVGNYTHYFKSMVKDANGQMSVSYTDMHGRTIATALAGESPGNLLALNINDPAHYPNQSGKDITQNLLNGTTNVIKNNSIEAINSLLVPTANTAYTFNYSLAPDKLELARCTTAVPLCYDCLYDLEISITNEAGDVPPVSWKFSNVSLTPDDTCTTSTPLLTQTAGTPVSVIGSNINFVHIMPEPGSYAVRKTLTLSEASLQRYREMYMQTGKGICKTEQEIIDSVYNVLIQTSDCNTPVTAVCDSCREQLGELPEFQAAYLTSLGNPPLTPELQAQILAAWNEGNEVCNSICADSSQLTTAKRDMMLADMMPYGGQYATDQPLTPLIPGSGTSMYDKYNIFQSGFNPSIQPYYKKPEPQNGANGRYRDELGNTDIRIHPDGTLNYLNTLNPDGFTNIFVNKWAEALLPYHPEYARLQYVEGTLEPAQVYNWINTFSNTSTYAAAQTAGYIMVNSTTINDPFYTIAPAQYKTDMANWLSNNYAGSNYSLWQMARAQVRCLNASNQQTCVANSLAPGGAPTKVPPFQDVTTTADLNKMWEAFRTLYTGARDNQVNNWIVAHVPVADESTLINQGYHMRFTSHANMATQYGWTWYPPTVGSAPPVIPGPGTGITYQSKCESYIPQWRAQLLQCDTLRNMPDTTLRNQIIDQITAGMVSVCVRGSDVANPMGSSSVPQSQWSNTLPNSFEQAVTDVYNLYPFISQRGTYYCNPYVIEFPKPYGKGPKYIQEYTSVVDSCACANFDSLKVRLNQASVNYTQLSAVNNYLLANSMDTLTSVLHAALLGCSGYQVEVCDTIPNYITTSTYDPDPCNTTCASKNSKSKSGEKSLTESGPVPTNCADWNEIFVCFFDTYPYPSYLTNCEFTFEQFFNGWVGSGGPYYDWNTIQTLYINTCNPAGLFLCNSSYIQNVECGYDTSCYWKFNPYVLSEPQPLPEFLKCGGWPPAKCLTCDTLVALTDSFKLKFDPPVNSGPVFTAGSLTPEQVQQNILYAQYLNFKTGYQYTWMEYAQSVAAANCDPNGGGGGGASDLTVTVRNGNTPQQYIASNSITFDPDFDHPVGDEYETLLQPNGGGGGGPQTVICRDNRYLNDTTGIFVIDTACHNIRVMSITLGQNIYQQQLLTIQNNLERQYREKCMAALNYESFTVNYTNKEYHYTLYYYDMAGSLVKTIPPKGVHPRYDQTFLTDVQNARNNCVANDNCTPAITPPHTFATNYRYNSLGQVVQQHSPDGGLSKFWYDRLGRLVVSQNAQQAIDGKYSYTLYDELGRITEVGQKPHSTAMTQEISQDQHPTISLSNWITTLGNGGGYREQMTLTGYDVPFGATAGNPNGILYGLGLDQRNMRNRVSFSLVRNLETDVNNPPYFYTGTFYTYDIHGNVDTLMQDYSGVDVMQFTGNSQKRMVYNYDLISGKVNMVSYQPDWYNSVSQEWVIPADKFFHKYKYDAENRLTEVWTSRNNIEWEKDASYSYYKHGPLNRTVLGQQQVQGIDYAYTIQGWLKGVNGTNAPTGERGEYDLGGDALNGGVNSKVAQDAYGFGLHYFDDGTNRDYQAIGANLQYFADPNNPAFTSLYNGNIGAMSVNIGTFSNKPNATNNELPMFYNYRYDQLNRIRSMDAYWGLGFAGHNANRWIPQTMNDYKEAITYDPNGNILNYQRNGSPSVPGQLPEMDRLGYNYYADKNQLRQIIDTVPDVNYDTDIDNQLNPGNYTYDAVGNLKSDVKEGITNIDWTVYGKIAYIEKDGADVTYTYDAAGNRITKFVDKGRASVTTIYVRDASGNVMSVYEKEEQLQIEQIETHLYGSSRIGMKQKDEIPAQTGIAMNGGYTGMLTTFTRGEKLFELSNHLGNVLVTISDRKLQMSSGGVLVDYYTADVVTATDYSSYGASLAGREFSFDKSMHGYNGQLRDKDIQKDHHTALFWEYDPRIGRRWNIDPVPKSMVSPYLCLGGNPIMFVDPLGNDWYKNKESGIIDWIDGSGKQKGYKHLWASKRVQTVDVNGNGEKHWVDFNSDGTKTIWIDPVTVTGTRKLSLIARSAWGRNIDANARRYREQTPFRDEYFRRKINGLPLKQYGDSQGYLDAFANSEMSYKIDKAFKEGGAIAAGVVLAPFAVMAAAESGALHYGWRLLKPSFQKSWAGGGADLFNQKIVQGKSWGNVNWFSVGANTFLGGGNIIKGSLWESTGAFINLSYNEQSIDFSRQSFSNFSAGFGGNLFGNFMTMPLGWTGKFAEPLTSLEKNAAALPFEVFGNIISNKLEN